MEDSANIYMIEEVAAILGENLGLLKEIARNPDNIDYGEMVHIHNGTEDGTTAFSKRGIESLREFISDIRRWEGGVRQFLMDEQCDLAMIELVMVDEMQREGQKQSSKALET